MGRGGGGCDGSSLKECQGWAHQKRKSAAITRKKGKGHWNSWSTIKWRIFRRFQKSKEEISLLVTSFTQLSELKSQVLYQSLCCIVTKKIKVKIGASGHHFGNLRMLLKAFLAEVNKRKEIISIFIAVTSFSFFLGQKDLLFMLPR